MSDCIFCKIASGEIPAKIVFEDDVFVCFHDLEPQAPVHVLIVPKFHVKSLDDLSKQDEQKMGHIMVSIKKIAELLELKEGYRAVINTGEDGGQTVEHLHIHLMGKRKMNWPAG